MNAKCSTVVHLPAGALQMGSKAVVPEPRG